ncbi:YgjV family protein [Flagellimonas sp. S174]|uniref:YgjV family protein n=1 Tax=Flagellimonas sp. S174 TaxID=3410790 RepID=UPI003BF61A70
MIDAIGYIAVITGLYAVTKKQMLPFRIWHIISCLLYMAYGFFNPAYPVLVSGSLFIVIHVYSLRKSKSSKKHSRNRSVKNILLKND